MTDIRLLVIENSRETVTALSAFFRRGGFAVQAAYDGESGVELFKSEPFDVVLVNYLLPKLSGLKTAMAIRTSPRGNQVGVALISSFRLSAAVENEAKQRADVDAVFTQPDLRQMRAEMAAIAKRYTGFGQVANTQPRAIDDEPSTPLPTPPKTPPERRSKAPAPGVPLPPAAAAPSPTPEPPPAAPDEEEAGRVFALDEELTLETSQDPIDLLLQIARERRTGALELSNEGARLSVLFRGGVPVGAGGNLRENRLGERLLRAGALSPADLEKLNARLAEGKERVAEALLALGLCDEDTLFSEMEAQAQERLLRAAGWGEGAARFAPRDPVDVAKMATGPLDLYAALLGRLTRYPDLPRIGAWARESLPRPALTTPDLEAGLMAYAKLAPESRLPVLLLSPERRTVHEILQELRKTEPTEVSAHLTHVYALFAARLLRHAEPATERPRVPVRLDEAGSLGVDKEAVRSIRRAWLRAQGRDLFGVLGQERDASLADVQGALEELVGRLGPEKIDLSRIGPAEHAARQLWALLDEARAAFADEESRATYARSLAVDEESIDVEEADHDANGHLLEGKAQLNQGRYEEAAASFLAAAERAPGEAEYRAFYGWALYLQGGEKAAQGRGELEAAQRLNTEAMRPVFLRGLVALQEDRVELARDLLREAARRCPDDIEVRIALESLPST